MSDTHEWDEIRPLKAEPPTMGWTALRISMLFGTLAIALALFAAPLLSGESGRRIVGIASGIDTINTATTPDEDRTYRLRRSVLQASPTSVCIIENNGTMRGEC